MNDEETLSRVDRIVDIIGWRLPYVPEKPWSVVEQALGISLPEDYKALLTRIPGGVIRGISVHSPVLNDQSWVWYKRNLDDLLQILGDEDLEYLANVEYRLFPAPGGLLPWGGDGQSGDLCWITDSNDPDEWRIAYYCGGADEWREHPGPMTQLLYEILTGEDTLLGWDFTDVPVDYHCSSLFYDSFFGSDDPLT